MRKPAAPFEKRFDVGEIRPTQRRQAQRGTFDRPDLRLGRGENRYRSAFDDEGEDGGTEQHDQK